MKGRVMAEITIACPATGQFVSVGSQMEPAEFDKLGPKILRILCSACGSEHLWSRATAWLVEAAAKSPTTSPGDPSLPKAVEAVTKPRSSTGSSTDLRPRERIADILERLLHTNETYSSSSSNKKSKQ
jgi:hypothetical protein